MTKDEEADLLYKMARMADEKLGDCERALAYYTMAAGLEPDASWATGAGRRSVACMEKLGRKKQAQSLLVQLTGDQAPANTPAKDDLKDSPVVAVIDGRSVAWAEVEAALMTRAGQDALADPEKRRQMLRDYVITWMLAEEARRMGLDTDPQVETFVEQARREALAASYLEKEALKSAEESAQEEFIKELFKIHEARIFNEAIPAP